MTSKITVLMKPRLSRRQCKIIVAEKNENRNIIKRAVSCGFYYPGVIYSNASFEVGLWLYRHNWRERPRCAEVCGTPVPHEKPVQQRQFNRVKGSSSNTEYYFFFDLWWLSNVCASSKNDLRSLNDRMFQCCVS